MSSRLLTGQSGEKTALQFLQKKGFELLEQNYRTRLGEIDLVCKDGRVIVFVEVKARRSVRFGTGAEAVDFKKQAKIMKTALYFLRTRRLDSSAYRFDVVSIEPGRGEIRHIENAFP